MTDTRWTVGETRPIVRFLVAHQGALPQGPQLEALAREIPTRSPDAIYLRARDLTVDC
ncbi:MAG TPA: hypothetical protein VLL82_06945 [Mycobacterium sp.]|nr:hypothetical protein [Mycobacterium sp.]